MEYDIKLSFVSKELMGEDQDNFRATMETEDDIFIGWGLTILEALQDLEKNIKQSVTR